MNAVAKEALETLRGLIVIQPAKPLSKVESEMQKGRRNELKVKTTFPSQ